MFRVDNITLREKARSLRLWGSSRFPYAVVVLVLVLYNIGTVAAEDRLGAEVRAWAKAHGADVDKVDLDAGDDGLALKASADFAADSTIMTIPAALLFPTSVHEASPVVSMIQNETIGRISAMCLYLIAEKKLAARRPDSFWAPWIRALPIKFHHALSYTDEDMLHFQASPFKELRARKKSNVEREYSSIVKPLLAKLPPKLDAAEQAAQDAEILTASRAAGKTIEEATAAADSARNLTAEDFTLEEYIWAYSIITTRAIFPGLLMDNERAGDVPLVLLGPLTDSMTHGEGVVKVGYDVEQQLLIFTAKSPIRRGDHISVGIGLTSNLELLANRGALVASNPSNFVLMKFQLDTSSDMHYSAREAMMRNLNLSNPMTYVVRLGEMPQGLLASLRIQALTPVEFSMYRKATQMPVTLDNEWRAYRLLISSCDQILDLYKSTREEDDHILLSSVLSRATRSAILLRRQEKLIYESVKTWANEAWNAILYASTSPPPNSPI